jgi:hypothetical protein
MAIIVVTERNSDGTFELSKTFPADTQAVVRHGRLSVTRGAGGDKAEVVASFAPGSWVSWNKDGVSR